MTTGQEENISEYTPGEEIANSVSHGIGVLLSIAGVVVLVPTAVIHGNALHVTSFSIFGATLMMVYSASTLYHSVTMPRLKRILQRIDHAVIFLLIAGTYMPFMLVRLHGVLCWSVLGLVWGLAAAGILLKTFFSISKYEKVSVGLYVLMGWLCVIVAKQLLANVPPLSLILLVSGGLSYTVGVIFYVWDRLPYNHAIWHIFVLGGSIFHYFSVLNTL
ncbi:hemolysin III [candidate division KSB3 bacterium]|uniref:Hemolysin III n=1 Tax=candidate division KSB3 bacterium TaxID=2044937 RepID=A0A2G6E0K8_9BACT|nr:MAG: hemolysin III [candidate division KSB3 bacterium]PIE31101.1 MAG: hemolysin III [candidate division KSB3 bacterium]